jgi:hypothetical protein
MTNEFDELLDDDVAPAERERLRRAHELLLAAGPMPELPPHLEEPVKPPAADIIPYFPKRRYAAGAVAIAATVAVAFGAGYLFGHRDTSGFVVTKKVRMHATAAAPTALGSIRIGKPDDKGNWPMLVKVSNLRELPPRGYYTLWLTRGGKPVAPCGTFRAQGASTEVTFTVAYSLKRFDGWVLTEQPPGEHEPGRVVLTT